MFNQNNYDTIRSCRHKHANEIYPGPEKPGNGFHTGFPPSPEGKIPWSRVHETHPQARLVTSPLEARGTPGLGSFPSLGV